VLLTVLELFQKQSKKTLDVPHCGILIIIENVSKKKISVFLNDNAHEYSTFPSLNVVCSVNTKQG
jgi:hypothetical protein